MAQPISPIMLQQLLSKGQAQPMRGSQGGLFNGVSSPEEAKYYQDRYQQQQVQPYGIEGSLVTTNPYYGTNPNQWAAMDAANQARSQQQQLQAQQLSQNASQNPQPTLSAPGGLSMQQFLSGMRGATAGAAGAPPSPFSASPAGNAWQNFAARPPQPFADYLQQPGIPPIQTPAPSTPLPGTWSPWGQPPDTGPIGWGIGRQATPVAPGNTFGNASPVPPSASGGPVAQGPGGQNIYSATNGPTNYSANLAGGQSQALRNLLQSQSDRGMARPGNLGNPGSSGGIGYRPPELARPTPTQLSNNVGVSAPPPGTTFPGQSPAQSPQIPMNLLLQLYRSMQQQPAGGWPNNGQGF